MKIQDIKEKIQYIEISKGKLVAHTANKSYRIKHRGKLKTLLEVLPKSYRMCSFDCIVDDNLVKEYDFIGNSFTLKTGEKVELLAKSYNLRDFYLKY
ncbi:MAG: LytTR family transcriptional regulator DNA-binding domain-containing protein [Bacilli bacterium]|nr:LytTR family transcriptional regulator DNA-binding domain-containing protein [Bacilli bacterium]MDE6141560.1 LytTR family transcriptional regulator DNA-binding domain-containing protein [Bacilli bacterium]